MQALQRSALGRPSASGRAPSPVEMGAPRLCAAAPRPAAAAAAAGRRGPAARAASPLASLEQQQRRPDGAAPAAAGGDAGGAPSTSAAAVSAPPSQRLSGRVARFRATKQATQNVRELQTRSLAEYMALPASQYSVLDARKIERVDDSTFRCFVGQLAFLGFSVEPVITVSVTVQERGCTIRLLSCELQGSRLVEDVNDKFTAQMTNEVTWAPTDDADVKSIRSDTTIEVAVEVPGWFILPTPAVEAAGSGVMAATVAAMVPRFLGQLEKDYGLWASGDDSRRPLGEGVL
ncbi:RAP release galactose-binding protein-like [Raphidocelis subcapitata]|uniref:RAP release galactose-binding protein-like n=1 Tax=Raphidocelis subcapitata TaxID=307507 RepID=A0A2V0NKA4_9CHLO|nr:RAP release galactose-binding protein-like [Raphidocelis subcapitata]|eukprot:GBF87734.1 RAP release galactose-binding protein-like [Raphidocelis subcapitata]